MLKMPAKSKSSQKVRDHYYYTGKYTGAPHSIESLIKIKDGCANNPENSSTTKIGYLMSTTWTFDRGKDCMETFCEYLREHTKIIIDFEKKKL